jgi:hypothetical protein
MYPETLEQVRHQKSKVQTGQIERVWEQDAEENIWTYEEGSDRRVEKTA